MIEKKSVRHLEYGCERSHKESAKVSIEEATILMGYQKLRTEL